jgi:hypothetical protein
MMNAVPLIDLLNIKGYFEIKKKANLPGLSRLIGWIVTSLENDVVGLQGSGLSLKSSNVHLSVVSEIPNLIKNLINISKRKLSRQSSTVGFRAEISTTRGLIISPKSPKVKVSNPSCISNSSKVMERLKFKIKVLM